jgi:intracellular sulfur oxidation DsrE/DsrF family protein
VTSSRVSDAIKAGVQVSACENTMRGQKLAPADMHPNVSYVPAGVTEIVRRQQDGWAYLRP